MSISSYHFLMKIEKPTIKTKNRLKKLIPSKPSFLIPSKAYNYFTEKEVKFIKKEAYNKFNNHPPNITLKGPQRNRNIKNNNGSLVNNTINNSFKNINMVLKNRNNLYDYRSNFNNDSLYVKNKPMKSINNYNSENNDDNKENLKNKYNINYNNLTIKNERTIIVNKANKMIKETKIYNNYKKLNLKSRIKQRTFSSNLNAIIKNINKDDNNNNNKTSKKNNRNGDKSKKENSNNNYLLNLFYKHQKCNSTMRNFKDNKNASLKSLSIDKINSSRSFSNSVDKRCINKKLYKNNDMNKSELNNNNKNIINKLSKNANHFYSSLKQILPYKGNSNVKNIERYRNESVITKDNQLSKSFTTNNFIKKFYLTQIGKFRMESENNKTKSTIDCPKKNRKIQDYYKYIKTNNPPSKNNHNNYFKYRKRHKMNSISNISDLDYQIINKSRESAVISQKNISIIEEPKAKVIKKILKIDSCTIPGYSVNGVKQKNQDSFFLKKNFLSVNEQFLIGICDGHGLFGDLVSQYISETLPSYIKNISKEELIKAYIDTNESLLNKTKIDCSLSGTTCTSLIITLDKIICANIGNTRAILARFENGCYNSVNLSRDHKPTESDEIKRIISEGGLIKQIYDKNRKEYIGPERIWLKNSDIPGLSMSRTFGDYIAHTVGVINIPEIKVVDFTGGEKFIVVASDSIWQYIDSDECIGIIKEYYEKNMDAIGALNSLVSEAIKRWKKQENKIEDITAVVIFFE